MMVLPRQAIAAWAVTLADLQAFFRDRAGMFWTFAAPLLCIVLFGALTQPHPYQQKPIDVHAEGTEQWLADGLRTQGIPVQSGSNATGEAWEATEVRAEDGLPAATLEAGAVPSVDERAMRMAISASVEARRAAIAVGGNAPPMVLDTLQPPVAAVSPATGFQRAVPAYLLMFLTLNVLAIGSHMVEDRARGRLQRLQVAGGDSTGLLAGKLGARWAVAMLQSLAMFGIGVFFFHIHVAHPFAVAGFMSLYVVALGSLGLVLGAWFRDQEKAQAVAVWGTMAACALGGVWWNVAGDPGVLGTLALCTPTGWGIAGLEALVNGGASVTVWLPCVLLLALAVVASMTAGRLLRR